MKHIVLTILLLLSITGSSQVTDEEWLVDYLGYNLIEITTYEMEIGISPECFSAIPISCYLNLYQDGYYYIEASYNTSDDMVTGFVISDGEYVFNDSILILNDSYGKANMKFIKRGDDLYPIEVYYFMKEKPMHFCRTEKVKDNKQYIGFRHATESEGKERIERFASKYNKEKYQLKYGKYSTEDWKGTTELYLRREKSYLLRCMDFVISRGEYELKDNTLILKDEDLNCEYELLVGEDCLMSKRIPTEYGCLLKYENEK